MYAPRDLANDNLSMTLRAFRAFGLLILLALGMTACDSGRENPADTRVRIVNVAPSYTSLYYTREHVTRFNGVLNVPFNGSADPATFYDEGTYDFYAYTPDLTSNTGVTVDPAYGFQKQLVAGTFYTFVFLEGAGHIEHAILESTPLGASSTDSQVQLLHGAENVPAVDIYLLPPGTTIAGATPWGSVSFRGSLAARSMTPGEYELTVTAAGNPAAVLLTSGSFPLFATELTNFVITPDNGTGSGQIAVAVIGPAAGGLLVDRNAPALVRALNTAADKAPRDVAFYGQFTPPLFPAAAFTTPTARAPLAAGTDIPLNVTPVGNPGVLELDQKVAFGPTFPFTVMFYGDAGALTHFLATDDLRRIAGSAKVRFYNAAPQFSSTALVLVPPGVDPTRGAPISLLLPGFVGTPIEVIPDTYDLYVFQLDTGMSAAGPLAVTLLDRGIYGVVVTNGDSSATANVALIDDFQ
jgi:hypothetical protein